jgi:hypothetical protein
MKKPATKPRKRNPKKLFLEPTEVVGRVLALPHDVSTSADWTDWGTDSVQSLAELLRGALSAPAEQS